MNKQLNHYWLIIPSVLVSLILYGFYISLAQPQVPYMDTMLFFVQIDQILRGEISWLDVYGSGDHRGIIYPFITFIEWAFWGVDARISTLLTGFVVAAIFYYWLKAFLSAQARLTIDNKKEVSVVFFICLIAAAIIVSPAGFELWTLDLGFAQLFKNFLIITFLYFLTIKQCWAKNAINSIVFGLVGGFLILFATYGWSYPFLAACLFALICSGFNLGNHWWRAGIVAVLMILAQVIYIYSGHGVFGGDKASSGLSIINLIKSIFFGASTAYIGNETLGKIAVPVIIPLLLGAGAILFAIVALLISVLEQTREKIFLSSLLIFSLMVLAGVALARGTTSYINTGASRYFVDFVWLVLAPMAIVFSTKQHIIVHPALYRFLHKLPLGKLLLIARLLAVALCTAAVLGHLATWYVELKTAPYRAITFKNMATVYHRGVDTESDAALLQAPFSVAKKAIDVAQVYNLSILRTNQIQCGLATAEYTGDWYPPEINHQRWLKKQGDILLGNCPAQITIKGFIPENFNAHELTVIYGETRQSVALTPGNEFSLSLHVQQKRRVSVKLQLDEVTVPAAAGINADTRELGVLLTYIGE